MALFGLFKNKKDKDDEKKRKFTGFKSVAEKSLKFAKDTYNKQVLDKKNLLDYHPLTMGFSRVIPNKFKPTNRQVAETILDFTTRPITRIGSEATLTAQEKLSKKKRTIQPKGAVEEFLFGKEKLRSYSDPERPGRKTLREFGVSEKFAPLVIGAGVVADVTPLGKGPKAIKSVKILDEVDDVFKVGKKSGIFSKVTSIPKKVRTSVISQYTPAQTLEENIYKAANKKKPDLNLARKLEQVAGANGKAEADIINFRKNVLDPVGKDTTNLNRYLFLKRTESRLLADPEVKKVGSWTAEKAKQGLDELRTALGEDKFNQIEAIATGPYQRAMDEALKLQVSAGRMSEEVYQTIKASNDFYAPFKVMKYFDDLDTIKGSGKRIATTEQLSKAIKGISEDDFQLGDFTQASLETIYKSRLLAEKNKAMLEFDKLLSLDPDGVFIKSAKVSNLFDTKPSKSGSTVIEYFKDGVKKAIEVDDEVATSLQGLTSNQMGLVGKAASLVSQPFRAGATVFNVPFQVVNLFLADLPRAALISKYGLRRPEDVVRFPLDWVHALYSSMSGNLGRPNQLYDDFLKSGVANSTIQRDITPQVFDKTLKKSVLRNVIESPAKFANAVEETSKVLGLKRGMRFEKIAKLPPDEAAKRMQEMVTEVRNYSGSPDFLRRGQDTRSLNLLFMFFNARVQGTVADISRLAGKTGKKNAAAAWARLGATVGIPATYLYMLNNSPEYKDDYAQVSQAERDNYFMIPQNKFFTNDDGVRVREYWRIPKRESVKLISNLIESSLSFANSKDPGKFQDYLARTLEDLSPINVTGDNLSERTESLISSMNPIIKAPVEFGTGRNSFYHSDSVSQSAQQRSPALQFNTNTPELFKQLGAVLNQSPAKLEQAVRSLTGGGLNQFTMGQPNEGRSFFSEFPLTKRFYRSTNVSNQEEFDKLGLLKREAADRSFQETQQGEELLKKVKPSSLSDLTTKLNTLYRKKEITADEYKKALDLFKDKSLGLTPQEKFIKYLPVTERTEYILDQLKRRSKEEQKEYLKKMAEKGIVTKNVYAELYAQGYNLTN